MFKKFLTLSTLTIMFIAITGCEITVIDPDPTPTYGYVKFVNNNETTVAGGTLKYSMHSLTGLGTAWPDTVVFGSQTVLKAVTPHTGDFVINGKIFFTGGADVDGHWDLKENINVGDTVVISLTMD